MASVAAFPIANAGLTPQQIDDLRLAEERRRVVQRTAAVATVDAWMTTLIAALAVLSWAASDWSALALGLALTLVAWNSFRGAKAMRRLDPTGPRLLALNQLLLAAIITLYCTWCIWDLTRGKNNLVQQLSAAGVGDLIDPKQIQTWMITFYLAVIAATFLAQGLLGLYYLTRRPHLERYLADTPPWIIDVERAKAGQAL